MSSGRYLHSDGSVISDSKNEMTLRANQLRMLACSSVPATHVTPLRLVRVPWVNALLSNSPVAR
jgi:hypothetical protein